MKKLIVCLSLVVFGGILAAQNRTSFSGNRNAYDYYYGRNAPALIVDVGTSATGAGTLVLQFGVLTLGDGTPLSPLATTAPITVGTGSNQETVTPSAVSCSTPAVYDTCSVTATFSNIHSVGEQIGSGTFGLIEAVNATHQYGGLVTVDGRWSFAGGLTTTITGNKGWTNVTVLDWRGTSGAVSYKAASNGANMAATAVGLY